MLDISGDAAPPEQKLVLVNRSSAARNPHSSMPTAVLPVFLRDFNKVSWANWRLGFWLNPGDDVMACPVNRNMVCRAHHGPFICQNIAPSIIGPSNRAC